MSYRTRIIINTICLILSLVYSGYFVYKLALNSFDFQQSGEAVLDFIFRILLPLAFVANIVTIRRERKREKLEDERYGL